MERLGKELGPEAAGQLADHIVPPLKQAYEYNCKRHSPENGDDELSFGVNIWRNSTYLLGVSCGDLPDGETIAMGLGFEVELMGRSIRFYKMPPRLGDNLDAFVMSGSKIRVAQARTNDAQLRLPFVELSAIGASKPGPSRFTRLVVVHQGNPLDGLRWIAIGAPSEEQGWHWKEKIFDASWPAAARGEANTVVEPTPAKPLDIRLKPEVVLARGTTESGA